MFGGNPEGVTPPFSLLFIESTVKRLLKLIEVPAPALPPILTSWLPNSLWLLWLELTELVVVEV